MRSPSKIVSVTVPASTRIERQQLRSIAGETDLFGADRSRCLVALGRRIGRIAELSGKHQVAAERKETSPISETARTVPAMKLVTPMKLATKALRGLAVGVRSAGPSAGSRPDP